MKTTTDREDEPLTPAGRLFLQPEMDQVINCVLGGDAPLDNIPAMRAELQSSIMLQHPRFCSILVRNKHGREHWRRTTVNVDDHLIVQCDPVSDDPALSDEDQVNAYMADLAVSSPLSLDKPLWEIHLLVAHKCAVFRVHHALGDGISLMSMLLSCCRRVDDPTKVPSIGGVGGSASPRRRWTLFAFLKLIWYTLVAFMEFLMRAIWMKDKKTAISGGAGVELWPRKLATARFSIDDMKTVKRGVANATINDVLFGMVSCGLSRYLDTRSPKDVKEGTKITGVAMVNLRPQSGLQDLSKLMESKTGTRWGNKFGMILLPVYYHRTGSDPLDFVKRAKAMIDSKKQSLEAPLSYKIGDLCMSLFSAKLASLFNYRILCNTTFTISNVVGPKEEITLVGNPVKYFRVNSTGLPHAITMHMVSYAGKADMQILVAKDIIPDPQVLAKCFEDALLEMKEAVTKAQEAS